VYLHIANKLKKTVDGYYEFVVEDVITATVADSENSSHYDLLY
jgi:hypothetical protein